jgi:hypothetical protein
VDVRRGEQSLCVEEDVVIYDLNAGNITYVIGSTEKRNLPKFTYEVDFAAALGYLSLRLQPVSLTRWSI